MILIRGWPSAGITIAIICIRGIFLTRDVSMSTAAGNNTDTVTAGGPGRSDHQNLQGLGSDCSIWILTCSNVSMKLRHTPVTMN